MKKSLKPTLQLDATIVQDDVPLEVYPKIFVGSIHAAFNQDSIVSNGITHILNASRLPNTFPRQFTYLAVEIRDKDEANVLSCIPTTNIFIEAGIEAGGILVHCFGGKSRSVAFIAAYLMSSLGWSFDDTYKFIKSVRPVAEMNRGFEIQLRAYGIANCDVYRAQQILLRTRIRELHLLRGNKMFDSKLSRDDDIPYTPAARGAVSDAKMTSVASSNEISEATSSSSGQVGSTLHHTHSDSVTDFAFLPPNSSVDRNDEKHSGFMDQSALHKRTWLDAKGPSPTTTLQPGMDLSAALNVADVTNLTISSKPDDKTGSGHHLNDAVASGELQLNLSRSSQIDDANQTNGVSPRIGSIGGGYAHISTGTERMPSYSTGSGGRAPKSRNKRNSRNRGDVETKIPMCRLSRPGSQAVRVMPPLRGLEREFKCSWCNSSLFRMANVIRIDLDIMPFLDDFKVSQDKAIASCKSNDNLEIDQRHKDVSSSSGPYIERAESKNYSDAATLPPMSKGEQCTRNKTKDSPNKKSDSPPLVDSMDISPRIELSADVALEDESDVAMDLTPQPVGLKSSRNAQSKSFQFDIPMLSGLNDSTRADELQNPSQAQSSTPRQQPFPSLSFSQNEMQNGQPRVENKPVEERNGAGISSNSSTAGWGKQSKQTMFSRSDYSPPGQLLVDRADADNKHVEVGGDSSHHVASSSGSNHNALPPPYGRPRSSSSEWNQSFSADNMSPVASSSGAQRYNTNYSSRPSSATRTLVMDATTRFTFGNSTLIDDSPRIQMPPHRLHGLGFSSQSDEVDRPQSAEKRRWLARMSLLHAGEGERKVAKMAEDDDYVSQWAFGKDDKYFYTEYLTWMGNEVFHVDKDVGDICCFGCRNVVGSWIWKPSQRILLDGKLEAPLFRIHKNVVYQMDVPLDQTPSSTPRIDSGTPRLDSSSGPSHGNS